MNRERMVDFLKYSPDIFDIIIIGGGATGLGAAVDSASRGYRTLLLESYDFAKATSSRSTKLIHGGLRYLQQGNIALVKEALHERGILSRNAPHLIREIPFCIPTYSWSENKYYQLGLKLYDSLAGNLKLKKSSAISKEEVIENFPTLNPKDLYGGNIYYDNQFDDSRLAITLAKTCIHYNGVVINYCPVKGLLKKNGKINGVIARDLINKEEYRLHAKAVVNATGIFTDQIRLMDNESSPYLIRLSQGTHLVLNKSILDSDKAIIIPKTMDKRVLFIIPWYNYTLIGTTDTNVDKIEYDPKAQDAEIDFLIKNASKYLKKPLLKTDILSVFTGLRPLINKKNQATFKISRKHFMEVSNTNLITITGGKWTIYRKMAEDVIDKAVEIANLKFYPSNTENLQLYGYLKNENLSDIYGTEREKINQIIAENALFKEKIHPKLPYLLAEIIFACKEEMAETLEDVLARRTRALFFNAKAAIEVADMVVDIMAIEKKKSDNWKKKQLQNFNKIAKNYLI
jgi:glycerol-3-phosphate dehydrogenase